MELGQFDYAPKTTYGKDSLLTSLISGQPSLVSERSLGTRLWPTMQVFMCGLGMRLRAWSADRQIKVSSQLGPTLHNVKS